MTAQSLGEPLLNMHAVNREEQLHEAIMPRPQVMALMIKLAEGDASTQRRHAKIIYHACD